MITKWQRIDDYCEVRTAGPLRLEARQFTKGWAATVLLPNGLGWHELFSGDIRPTSEEAKNDATLFAAKWAHSIMQALGGMTSDL